MIEKIKKKFTNEGYVVCKFKSNKIVSVAKKIIKKHFFKSTKFYCNLELDQFHRIALNCQNEINRSKIVKYFDQAEGKIVRALINNEIPLYESFIFLRAVRPANSTGKDESVSLHRESFYTKEKYIKYAVNIWFPIMNVGNKSYIKYIPKSHQIPDDKIKRKRINLKYHPIKRFSDGHRLGFFYAPKKILSGVNLKKLKKMKIPKNYYALFSSMLVHGNGTNNNNKIRFALGWGFLPKSKMKKIRKVDPRRFKSKKKYFKQVA